MKKSLREAAEKLIEVWDTPTVGGEAIDDDLALAVDDLRAALAALGPETPPTHCPCIHILGDYCSLPVGHEGQHSYETREAADDTRELRRQIFNLEGSLDAAEHEIAILREKRAAKPDPQVVERIKNIRRRRLTLSYRTIGYVAQGDAIWLLTELERALGIEGK